MDDVATEEEEEPDRACDKRRFVMSRKRKKTRDSMSQQPRTVQRKQQFQRDLLALRERNPELYEAIVCSDAREIVRKALINRHNWNNLAMLEWSEGVMLQLCYLHEPLDLSLLTWKRVLDLLRMQWRREVMLPIVETVGRHATLASILRENHERKLRHGFLGGDDQRVFHETPPGVSHRVIRTFTVKNASGRARQFGKPPATTSAIASSTSTCNK